MHARILHAGRLAVALLLASICAVVVADDPPGDDDSWSIERFAWDGSLAAGARLVVDNPFGNIHARTSEARQVEISAVMQRHAEDGVAPRITVEPVAGRLEVRVRWPDADPARPPRGRVDLTIFVPPGAPLEAHTQNGLIQAKKLRSDIEARSASGEIHVSTYGTVNVRSIHGRIHVLLASAQWSSPPRLETTTGEIEFWLPSNADATLTASTTGLLTTDYSLEVRTDDSTGFKHATAKLGAGHESIEIRSQKGHLMLLRSPIEPVASER